jgi:hypothetical protein
MAPQIGPGEAGPGFEGPEYEAMVAHLAERIGVVPTSDEERRIDSQIERIGGDLDIATASGDIEGEIALRRQFNSLHGETDES